MNDQTYFWTPKNEWQAKMKALETASNDLLAEFETDAEGDFYVEAHTQALTDFLLLPINEPKPLLVKLHLIKEHEIFSWQQSSFETIWAALIEDTKRIAGWTEPKELP